MSAVSAVSVAGVVRYRKVLKRAAEFCIGVLQGATGRVKSSVN
jgi:hypothetical protein